MDSVVRIVHVSLKAEDNAADFVPTVVLHLRAGLDPCLGPLELTRSTLVPFG